MADLNYIYSPYYGVEPFDPNTSGAVLTGQNLVVTAWEVEDKGGDLFLEVGSLIQPASQNSNLSAARRAAGVQAMHSRYSAQMFFAPDTDTKPLPFSFGAILFVLNPPVELRQQWANAVVFNGGDTEDLNNYTVKKSLMGGYTWTARVDEGAPSQNLFESPKDLIVGWGTNLDLGAYDGSPMEFPLLKTSGADGQPPQFFDNETAQDVQEMLTAVNNGSFFVPMVIYFDFSEDNVRLTITYPHSTARG